MKWGKQCWYTGLRRLSRWAWGEGAGEWHRVEGRGHWPRALVGLGVEGEVCGG